jgi:serine/threonine protein kinase
MYSLTLSLPCNQVCELLDFGVQGVEYWMVMEAGKMDLLAWRNSSPSKGKRLPRSFGSCFREGRVFEDMADTSGRDYCEGCNTDEELPSGDDLDVTSTDGREPLTQHKLAVCLALYADALLIVQSVHSARVLHFDIKCNNFILRCEPDLDTMYR